jgi:hypothetical protein
VEPAPPAVEESALGPDAPLEELRRLAGELQTESARLYEIYGTFLEQKEDGGGELTDADEQLQEELEVFAEAAGKLEKGGFFARIRGRRPGDRGELARRGQSIAQHGRKVDALMAQVQPSPEVRQAWSGVRRRWLRIAEIIGQRR